MSRSVAGTEAQPAPQVAPAPIAGRLWIDISCDVLEVDTHMGATEADGVIAKAEAGTVRLTIADPDGTYDPLSPTSPFRYRGRSRLAPGTPILIWAEWMPPGVGPGATGKVNLFAGAVDTWAEDWTPHRNQRRAVVTGSDFTSRLVALNREEQPPQGAGETSLQRFTRIMDFFDIPPENYGPTGHFGTSHEQATTLAQSAWELLSRLQDDEIGLIWVDTYNRVNFQGQTIWAEVDALATKWGCGPGVTAHDCILSATVGGYSYNLRNAVYGARTGGSMQVAKNQTSINRYKEYSYKRTDLGLSDDSEVANWARTVLNYSSTPEVKMSDFTINPKAAPDCWNDIGTMIHNLLSPVEVYWTPPDRPETTYEVTGRVVGIDHAVTRDRWNTRLILGQSSLAQNIWHMGPHPLDKLDDGNVIGLYKTEVSHAV